MKKYNVIKISLLFMIVTLFCNIKISKAEEIDRSKYKSDIIHTAKSENIKVDYSYGYNDYGKYGRFLNFSASIYSFNSEFQGTIEVSIPSSIQRTVYKKDISTTLDNSIYVVEHENEKVIYAKVFHHRITMSIPVIDETGLIEIAVKNTKEKVVLVDKSKIKIGNYYKEFYVGVLSDNFEELIYLDKPGIKLIELDETTLFEADYHRNNLDVIIINNYDSSKLDKELLDKIEKWVLSGGNLIIGTGKNSSKTLQGLKEFEIKNYPGQQVSYLCFGLSAGVLEEYKQRLYSYIEERTSVEKDIEYRNQVLLSRERPTIEIEYLDVLKIEQDIIDTFSIIGASKIMSDVYLLGGRDISIGHDKNLGFIKTFGDGAIQLYRMDLGLKEESMGLQLSIMYMLLDNLTEIKKNQIFNEYYGYNTGYGLMQGLNYSDTTNIPKVWEYMFVIILYLLIIGPIAYKILKKYDKRAYTWIVIPICSIVFCGIVYILGARTRIANPYLGYIQLKTYQDNSMVLDEVFFSITNSTNQHLELSFDHSYPIKEFSNYEYNWLYTDNPSYIFSNFNKYSIDIYQEQENTTIEIDNKGAFSSSYFQMKNVQKEVNMIGENVYYKDTTMNGFLQNNFPYSIENAVFVSNGFLYHVGSMEPNERVRIESLSYEYINVGQELYESDFIYELLNVEKEKTLTQEEGRKYAVIQNMIERTLYNNEESYFIGFAPNSKNSQFIKELQSNMNNSGIKGIVVPIHVSYNDDGITFGPTLDPYRLESDGRGYYYSRYLYGEQRVITYQLPSDQEILKLYYLKNRNTKITSEYITEFHGDIYLKNWITKEYDLVFEDGVDGVVSQLRKYINNKNQIEIVYRPDYIIEGRQMILPHISYKAKE